MGAQPVQPEEAAAPLGRGSWTHMRDDTYRIDECVRAVHATVGGGVLWQLQPHSVVHALLKAHRAREDHISAPKQETKTSVSL